MEETNSYKHDFLMLTVWSSSLSDGGEVHKHALTVRSSSVIKTVQRKPALVDLKFGFAGPDTGYSRSTCWLRLDLTEQHSAHDWYCATLIGDGQVLMSQMRIRSRWFLSEDVPGTSNGWAYVSKRPF
ncbi:hypothetical protein VMCG_03261 [Cytospora schulzeri]|uniref:Uncharacterized protein n=1 Tax=Cytospora schulzeri TaxID=448051 RepID=A0A423WXX2_9PEZI|nr:hypothetical protein VMCG_03261 [Valsa malicola]